MFLFAQGALGEPGWDISEIALPERCVLWEVTAFPVGAWAADDAFRMALGDQLPTSLAMMSSLNPLLHGMGRQGPEPRQTHINSYVSFAVRRLRVLIESCSMRPILEVKPVGDPKISLNVVLVFSSIPREVEDWLLSAKAINL